MMLDFQTQLQTPEPTSSYPIPWRLGEHTIAIGTTGTGKTFLVSELVKLRDNVVVFRTKEDDIDFDGFRMARDIKPMRHWKNERLLIMPKYDDQWKVGHELLEEVFSVGRWTIVIDEFFYTQRLGLQKDLEKILTQGRSKKITVVLGVQRPVQVTRFAVSESRHIFCFRVEGRDLKTLRDITTPKIMGAVDELGEHDFVHYHIPTRSLSIGNAKSLDRVVTRIRS